MHLRYGEENSNVPWCNARPRVSLYALPPTFTVCDSSTGADPLSARAGITMSCRLLTHMPLVRYGGSSCSPWQEIDGGMS